jgi:hypothetical protein
MAKGNGSLTPILYDGPPQGKPWAGSETEFHGSVPLPSPSVYVMCVIPHPGTRPGRLTSPV